MNTLVADLLAAAAFVAAAAFSGWLLGQETGTLVAALSALVAVVLRQFWQLARLVRWVERPYEVEGTETPSARGTWERVYGALHRRARHAMTQREQLGQMAERFRLAAEALPDGVVILDGQRCIEWMNAHAESCLGLNAHQDRGAPVTQLVREPEFVDYLAAGYSRQPLLFQSLRRPGRSLQIQLAPFAAGRTLLLARDVTQLQRLETMRRDFVANVSHELKTPLTVISGFIETLGDGLEEFSRQEQEHFLGLAGEQATRMQRLIDDLLTLSALETDRPPPDERVEMGPLLGRLREDAVALSAGRHRIEATDEGGPPVIVGSAAELHSAFGNLMTNAVRYTPRGGRITLRWQRRPDGQAAFEVEDDGIGIEARHLPRLTERFYRVDRGRSRESGGTGLGLAIVKHVLERHGASLEISSEVGKGSSFRAVFPPSRFAG